MIFISGISISSFTEASTLDWLRNCIGVIFVNYVQYCMKQVTPRPHCSAMFIIDHWCERLSRLPHRSVRKSSTLLREMDSDGLRLIPRCLNISSNSSKSSFKKTAILDMLLRLWFSATAFAICLKQCLIALLTSRHAGGCLITGPGEKFQYIGGARQG